MVWNRIRNRIRKDGNRKESESILRKNRVNARSTEKILSLQLVTIQSLITHFLLSVAFNHSSNQTSKVEKISHLRNDLGEYSKTMSH